MILHELLAEHPHGPPAPRSISIAWSKVARYAGKAPAVKRLAQEDAGRPYDMRQYCWRLVRRSKSERIKAGKKAEEPKRVLGASKSDSPRSCPGADR